MEIYKQEMEEAMNKGQETLWRFVRIPDGLYPQIEKKNQFHPDVYRMACAFLLSEKYSDPTPENVKNYIAESAKLERQKPLDAGFVLLFNNIFYVFGGSTGFTIPEDNGERPETIRLLRINFPNLQTSLSPDAENTFERLKIA